MLSWLFSDPLPIGTKAPDFELPSESGKTVKLSALRGKNVVLVFYPADDTTICRQQLCEFRDNWSQAKKRNTVVFGVNPQSAGSHRQFRADYEFPFPLLVDAGQKVAGLYHASGLLVNRTVYLVGHGDRELPRIAPALAQFDGIFRGGPCIGREERERNQSHDGHGFHKTSPVRAAVGDSPASRLKPSSFHPSTPPTIFFTFRPRRASRIAARSAPLQCEPLQ